MYVDEKIIIELIEKVINQNVSQEENLLDDAILDSLGTIMLIDELEKYFSIVIPPKDFTHFNFNSIKNINKMVEKIIN